MEKDPKELFDDILHEWSWRVKDPTNLSFANQENIYHLKEAMKELDLPSKFIDQYISNITKQSRIR